jgi:formate dehydrogenase iron-sulfur subunit
MANMRQLSAVDILNKRKGLLITPELCIGCRGCQSACKEWNMLPGERTINRGTYENPPDVSANLYNKIRFVEVSGGGGLRWLFISQRCMHCNEAGCMQICPAPGAITKNKLGAVVFNKERCIGCKLCSVGCPFDVPRYDAADRISKCHLCQDRIEAGLEPACSKVCPTDSIRYGDWDRLIAVAKAEGYATLYGRADLKGLGVMYAFKEKPGYYGFETTPGIPASVAFWRKILKPLTIIGIGASVAAAASHYVSYGPQDGDGEGGGEE